MTPDRPDERGRRRMRDQERTEGDARRREGVTRADDGPPATGSEIENPDTSLVAAALGRVGVYLGVAAVGFAVLGIALGVVGAGLLTRVAFVLALGLGVLSMVLAAVFQASAGGLLRGD
jgi:predicted phage tail protein